MMARLDFVNLNTRVTGIAIGEPRASGGETFGIFVEDNVTLIFNELDGVSEYTSNWGISVLTLHSL